MKCNQPTWCERSLILLKNPAHVFAEAGEDVETAETAEEVLAPQQPPAVPPNAMNSETVDGDQDSSPPSTDNTEGQLGDD